MPLTMMQKRADLASLLTSLLQAHDAEFVIDTTERKELELGTDRKSRLKIMPDNKYCVIYSVGQQATQPTGLDAAGNAFCRIGHRFEVRIFYGKDYDTSQDKFEQAIYNSRSATAPGVLDSIRSSRTRIVAGEEYTIGDPAQDAFINIQQGDWDFGALSGKPELAHYLRFEVSLIG